MKITGNYGFTLIEVIMSLAILSFIVLAIHQGFHVTQKGTLVAKESFENQTNAKGALQMMSYEIRNCRDLLMPSDETIWPRDQEVHSPFLSFQKYKTKTYSNNFSTITYSLEQDKLYRYEHYGADISKRMILDNLLPGTNPFYLTLGDVDTTRNIGISLTMKNKIMHKTDTFSTNIFVQNPPAIGSNLYDDLP